MAGLAGLRARPPLERRQRPRWSRRRGRRPRSRRRPRPLRRRRALRRPAPRRRHRHVHRVPRRAAPPGRIPGRPHPAAATPSSCSPRTPPAVASGTSSPCPACRRAPGRTCGCAAACWATSGSSTCSPGSPSPPAPPSRGSRRCWPRNVGCSTSPAPAPATPCWSARSKARTSSRPASSTSSIRCPPGQADRPVHRPGRALVLAELVGELRRAACAPDGPDPAPRRARRARAAAQLARLAEAGVPGAHPDDWYGAAPVSTDAPLRPADADRPGVPLRRREDPPLPAALGVGAARRRRRGCARRGHRLAWCTRWSRPRRRARPPRELDARPALGLGAARRGAPWFSRRELARVRGMLGAFDGWVRASRAEGLRLVAVEQPVQLDLVDGIAGGAARSVGRRLRLRGPGRPAGGRRGRAARRRRRQDRPHRGQRARGGRAPAARALPARGRAGRVRQLVERGAPPGRGPAGVRRRPARRRPGQGARPAAARRRRASRTGSRCCTPAPPTRPEPVFVARVGPDCDRCPVRTACPAHGAGRGVPDA